MLRRLWLTFQVWLKEFKYLTDCRCGAYKQKYQLPFDLLFSIVLTMHLRCSNKRRMGRQEPHFVIPRLLCNLGDVKGILNAYYFYITTDAIKITKQQSLLLLLSMQEGPVHIYPPLGYILSLVVLLFPTHFPG